MIVQVVLLPEHPRRCSANRACVLVLVQGPVAPEGELKAKPIWVCLVLAEAIKGKVQVAAVSGAGSMWHTVGCTLGGTGAVCPLQCISQSSCNQRFTVLQDPSCKQFLSLVLLVLISPRGKASICIMLSSKNVEFGCFGCVNVRLSQSN